MEMGPHPSSGRRVIPTDERGGGPAISARLPLSGVAAHCSSRDRVERPTSVQSDDLLLRVPELIRVAHLSVNLFHFAGGRTHGDRLLSLVVNADQRHSTHSLAADGNHVATSP